MNTISANAASNAAYLARLAGVPLPKISHNAFSFVIWEDHGRWGHIDLAKMKVTEWNPAASRHETIFQA